jgi:hypothetical protein
LDQGRRLAKGTEPSNLQHGLVRPLAHRQSSPRPVRQAASGDWAEQLGPWIEDFPSRAPNGPPNSVTGSRDTANSVGESRYSFVCDQFSLGLELAEESHLALRPARSKVEAGRFQSSKENRRCCNSCEVNLDPQWSERFHGAGLTTRANRDDFP